MRWDWARPSRFEHRQCASYFFVVRSSVFFSLCYSLFSLWFRLFSEIFYLFSCRSSTHCLFQVIAFLAGLQYSDMLSGAFDRTHTHIHS